MPQLPTCAVLGFDTGAGLTAEDANFIRSRFAALLPQYDLFDEIAESHIQGVLKVSEFNRSDFTSTMDYALEIGKILQIRYVIIGSVGRIDDLFSLNTSVVDIETGIIIHSAVTDHRGKLSDFAMLAAEKNIRTLKYGQPAPAPEKDRRMELDQARRRLDRGLYKEAAEATKKMIGESGPSMEAHILLGQAYAKQKGWYNLAVRELESHHPGSRHDRGPPGPGPHPYQNGRPRRQGAGSTERSPRDRTRPARTRNPHPPDPAAPLEPFRMMSRE